MTVSHVLAEFDGKERRFQISRKLLPSIEARLVGGAYATLKRFLAGEWTFADVQTVLAYALYRPDQLEALTIDMGLRAAAYGVANFTVPAPVEFVRGVLLQDGHGNHAGLAALVLRAAILGINDDEVRYVADAE